MRLKLAFMIAVAAASLGFAQVDPPGRVARLNYISGTVSFQPGGVDDWVPAIINRPLTTGDHLWVDQNGRAEMHLGAAALRLDARTALEFLNLNDQNVQIRLPQGSMIVRLRRLDQNETFEVDTPNMAFSLLRPGTYRIDANPDSQTTIVTTRGGEGEVTGGAQAFSVKTQQQARITGDQSITYDLAGAPAPDWFDTWCASRDRGEDQSRSAQYVSREMIGYEDLDAAGDWRPVPDYGNVWYPRAMPAGWAPYRYGHWAFIEPWGWTWVDDAPWGFAPFHYGRWAFVAGGWCWVPGPVAVRPVYAPALVAWVGGPHFSLSVSAGGGAGIAWFPLGPREVFVPAYHVSPAYANRINVVNVYNVTNVYVNRSAPAAVTAVSTATFVSARPVHRELVEVDVRTVATAQVLQTAPVAPVRASVMGRATVSANVSIPPAGLMARPVVARATPPPPPVAFERRQTFYQQQPGRPIEPAAAQQLRVSAPPRANVRQAGPVSAGNATTQNPVTIQPQTPRVEPSRMERPVQQQQQPRPTPTPQAQHPPVQHPAAPQPPRNEQLRRPPAKEQKPAEKGREREPKQEDKERKQQ